MSTYIQFFKNRLFSKLTSLIPTIAISLILFLILSVIFYISEPYYPASIQLVFDELQKGNLEAFKNYIGKYGSFSSVVFLIIQIIQVLISPVPGQFSGLAGGYLFGFWQGTILSIVGLTLGSFIVFVFSRYLGRRVVLKLLPESKVDSFKEMIEGGGLSKFFLIFLLPVLPDDTVCFVAGLTKIKIWKLVLANFFGRLPGVAVVSYIGANSGNATWLTYTVIIVTSIIGILLWFFYEEIVAVLKISRTEILNQ